MPLTEERQPQAIVAPSGERAFLSDVLPQATELVEGQIGILQGDQAAKDLDNLGVDTSGVSGREVTSRKDFDDASQRLQNGEFVSYVDNKHVYVAGKSADGKSFTVNLDAQEDAQGLPEVDMKVSVTSDGVTQTLTNQERLTLVPPRASLRTVGQGAKELNLEETATYKIEKGGQSAIYIATDSIDMDGKLVKQGAGISGDKSLTDKAFDHTTQVRQHMLFGAP